MLTFVAAINGCQSVPVYDKQVCVDLGTDGAHCNNSYTNAPVDIPKKDWDEMQFGRYSMTSTDFNNDQTSLDQLCQINPCDFHTREVVETLKKRMNELYNYVQWSTNKKLNKE